MLDPLGAHAVHHENSRRDDVGRAIGQHAIGVDRPGAQGLELHPAAPVAEAAHQHPRADDRRVAAADADVGQAGANRGVFIAVEVVDRQRALVHVHAILLRLFAVVAAIAGRDVELIDGEVQVLGAAAHQDGHLPCHAQVDEGQVAHVRQAGLRVDGTRCRRCHHRQVLDAVVRRQANAVAVVEAQHAAVFVAATEHETRWQSDGVRTQDGGLQLQVGGPGLRQACHQFVQRANGDRFEGHVHALPRFTMCWAGHRGFRASSSAKHCTVHRTTKPGSTPPTRSALNTAGHSRAPAP